MNPYFIARSIVVPLSLALCACGGEVAPGTARAPVVVRGQAASGAEVTVLVPAAARTLEVIASAKADVSGRFSIEVPVAAAADLVVQAGAEGSALLEGALGEVRDTPALDAEARLEAAFFVSAWRAGAWQGSGAAAADLRAIVTAELAAAFERTGDLGAAATAEAAAFARAAAAFGASARSRVSASASAAAAAQALTSATLLAGADVRARAIASAELLRARAVTAAVDARITAATATDASLELTTRAAATLLSELAAAAEAGAEAGARVEAAWSAYVTGVRAIVEASLSAPLRAALSAVLEAAGAASLALDEALGAEASAEAIAQAFASFMAAATAEANATALLGAGAGDARAHAVVDVVALLFTVR